MEKERKLFRRLLLPLAGAVAVLMLPGANFAFRISFPGDDVAARIPATSCDDEPCADDDCGPDEPGGPGQQCAPGDPCAEEKGAQGKGHDDCDDERPTQQNRGTTIELTTEGLGKLRLGALSGSR